MQLPWPRSWQPAGRRIKVLVLQLVQLAVHLICAVLLARSVWVLCSTVDYFNANADPKEGGKAPAASSGQEGGTSFQLPSRHFGRFPNTDGPTHPSPNQRHSAAISPVRHKVKSVYNKGENRTAGRAGVLMFR